MKVDVSKVVRKYAIIIVLIILIAVFSFLSPAFATFNNAMNVVRQISMMGIVTVGFTFVLLGGGLDLSVGSQMAVMNVVMAMMKNMTYTEALKDAIRSEMLKDPNVFLAGEDISVMGGSFGVSAGLFDEFGPNRIVNTPISETAIVGLGVGAAAAGMRPIVELMYFDFAGCAMDEIMNQAAKMRYMFGGKCKLPMVIRAAGGATVRAAAQHSQMIEAMFTHIPGIKVVLPSNPADAKGLLLQAIEDDNPVMFVEHKALYSTKGDVPEDMEPIPFGKANVVKEGKDITIIAWSYMVHVAMEAAEKLKEKGVDAEVIDARTLVPFDKETLLNSVKKTHRLAIVSEAVRTYSFASEIAMFVSEECFDDLDEIIIRITSPDCPIPYSPVLEDAYVPNSDKVVEKVMELF